MQEAANINVLAELEHCGIKYEYKSDDEVVVKCPFHDDSSPSCNVNVKDKVFCCHVAGCEGNKGGDFIDFLAGVFKAPRAAIVLELSKRYDLGVVKTVESSYVEECHARLSRAFPLLSELRKRGVTNKMIRRRRLGEHEGRVTIPVKNEQDLFVNVRKYLPGAPGKDKMKNLRGRGKPRIYPIDQMSYEEIWLDGGEIKAVVAEDQLNPHGVGAVCITSGETQIPLELIPKFVGKTVYVAGDIDKAGKAAQQMRARQLHGVATEVYLVHIPLDIDKYPKGDTNDFVGQEDGQLYPLLELAEEYTPSQAAILEDTIPEDVALSDASNASNAGRRIRVKATISLLDIAPYVVPKVIRSRCDKSQNECALCPLYPTPNDKHEIPPESSAILEFISCKKNQLREATMNGLGVPRTCQVVEFEPLEYYNAEDARVTPQLAITNRSSERIEQPAICIGSGLELNESYMMTGRMYPNPHTQQSTLLISNYEATRDALTSYEVKDLEKLEMFRPREWSVEAIQERLDNVYADFESNVTRIWQRRDLHTVVDMIYHTPLLMNFDGRREKGWGEALILGDSGQGKSEVTCGHRGDGGLMAHYGLGEKVECKNATVAGLLGGLQQSGKRFFVSWGFIPTHDKRLVIMEELKGASTEVIGKLTDMRSSGIAEIPKIEKRRTSARTRLIMNSNPRVDGRSMSTYNFGVDAIRELIGGLEDIRRFDICHIISKQDVDPSVINQLTESRPIVEHTHTSELCRSLVLWAWTRECEQVVFEPGVTGLVMKRATELCEEFTDAIPILDRGSARLKIARLAAAMACRTFSSTDDHTGVRVRDCHVEFVCRFLQRTYSSQTFGYKAFSEADKLTTTLLDPNAIVKQMNDLPHPRDFVKHMLNTNSIDVNDLADWTGWDRSGTSALLSFLVRKHALVRGNRNSYFKTPLMIGLLKDLLQNGHLQSRPDFIAEKKEEF